jgi:hypothetical protein
MQPVLNATVIIPYYHLRCPNPAFIMRALPGPVAIVIRMQPLNTNKAFTEKLWSRAGVKRRHARTVIRGMRYTFSGVNQRSAFRWKFAEDAMPPRASTLDSICLQIG